MPEGSDLRCLNGGARLWFNYSTCSSPPCNSKNPDVPIFGNAKCECVDEWAGVDCGLCTADGQCGADSCNRYIHPFASTITAELIEFGHRVIGCVLAFEIAICTTEFTPRLPSRRSPNNFCARPDMPLNRTVLWLKMRWLLSSVRTIAVTFRLVTSRSAAKAQSKRDCPLL